MWELFHRFDICAGSVCSLLIPIVLADPIAGAREPNTDRQRLAEVWIIQHLVFGLFGSFSSLIRPLSRRCLLTLLKS